MPYPLASQQNYFYCMISEAARKYEQLYRVRPKNTPDRARMYNSMEIQMPYRPSPRSRPFLASTDRTVNNSFHLRHSKETIVNTDYSPRYDLVNPNSRRQGFSKVAFTRIIGDVRQDDYSLPLIDSCDRRCSEAFVTLPHQASIRTAKDVHKNRAHHHHIKFEKQLSRDNLSESANLRKQISIQSTEHSDNNDLHEIAKKISKRVTDNFQRHEALKKIRHFDHDIGHKYAEKLFTPKQVPDSYHIESSNQGLIKKSMSSPKGHIRFDNYRDQIATRTDRADPHWGMTLNYEDAQVPEWSSKTIDLSQVSGRKPNEVFSKYAIRQNMELRVPRIE